MRGRSRHLRVGDQVIVDGYPIGYSAKIVEIIDNGRCTVQSIYDNSHHHVWADMITYEGPTYVALEDNDLWSLLRPLNTYLLYLAVKRIRDEYYQEATSAVVYDSEEDHPPITVVWEGQESIQLYPFPGEDLCELIQGVPTFEVVTHIDFNNPPELPFKIYKEA